MRGGLSGARHTTRTQQSEAECRGERRRRGGERRRRGTARWKNDRIGRRRRCRKTSEKQRKALAPSPALPLPARPAIAGGAVATRVVTEAARGAAAKRAEQRAKMCAKPTFILLFSYPSFAGFRSRRPSTYRLLGSKRIWRASHCCGILQLGRGRGRGRGRREKRERRAQREDGDVSTGWGKGATGVGGRRTHTGSGRRRRRPWQ